MPTRRYGLIGHPLSHSFSARYFSEKFATKHIDARYDLYDIPAITLLPEITGEPNPLDGFNVTTPYKEQVISYLDTLSPEAATINAVNVVKRLPDGSLRGYNTDIEGFRSALLQWLENSPLPDGALVLGTGGAARAVNFALQSLGIPSITVSRRPGNGRTTYDEIDAALVRSNPLIINATPLGMGADTGKLPPFPMELLGPQNLCFDLIYNPAETLFLKESAKRGARTANGLAMLYAQADAAWKIWSE